MTGFHIVDLVDTHFLIQQTRVKFFVEMIQTNIIICLRDSDGNGRHGTLFGGKGKRERGRNKAEEKEIKKDMSDEE